jgi:O-acetylserine/cysteine efflux transporter
MSARDLLLITLICLAWGGNFLTSAISLQTFPPFLFTALRLALLALLLFPWLKRPGPGQWPRLLVACIFTGVLHFGLAFWGLRDAGNLASPAIVLQSYVPMTTLLAIWLLGERIGWRSATGIAISFGGVLVLGFDPLVLAAPQALMLTLAGALCLSIGTVAMRRLKGVDPFSMQAWTAVIGVLPLLLLSAVFETGQLTAIQAASWPAWSGVVYSAVVSSLFGHGIFYWLLQRHPVSTLTPYLLLTPVFAVILGLLFYGDRLGPRLLVGGALVLAGVLVVALRARVKSRELPRPVDV